MSTYWVYMLSSKPHGTLYIGVTNGIVKRVADHRAGLGSAFTKRYKIHSLVWFEEYGDIEEAIEREAQLKSYYRAWKINLIERMNPHWTDLFPALPGVSTIPKDWKLPPDGSPGSGLGQCRSRPRG